MKVQDYIKKLSKLQLLSVIESSGYLKNNQDELDKFISEIKPLPVSIVRKQFLGIEILNNYIEEVLLPEYLDEYYSNITNEEIIQLCEKYNIRKYTINDDKTIDVNGHVNFGGANSAWAQFNRLPIRFNSINGDFFCFSKKLNSFVGFPKNITGQIKIHGNFKSLENFPIVNFYKMDITSHSLETLEGLQGQVEHINLTSNSLTSFKGLPKSVKTLDLECKSLIFLDGLHDNIRDIKAYNTPINLIIDDFKGNVELLMFDTIIEPSENKDEKPNLYHKLYVEKLKYIGKEQSMIKLNKLEQYYKLVH